MTTYDAVVVGAGPNGLVAANHLLDHGWSVLVLEAQPEVGGAVRSDGEVHPAFVHDTFSAFYPLAAASRAIRDFRLEEHGLRWRHAPAVLGHPRPDGEWALLHRDREVTATLMERQHGGDGEAWLRLCAAVGRHRRPPGRRPADPVPPGPGRARPDDPAEVRGRPGDDPDPAHARRRAGPPALRRHVPGAAAGRQRRARRHPARCRRVRADGPADDDARADGRLPGPRGRRRRPHPGPRASRPVPRRRDPLRDPGDADRRGARPRDRRTHRGRADVPRLAGSARRRGRPAPVRRSRRGGRPAGPRASAAWPASGSIPARSRSTGR